ncbi:MAG: hypothetical protein U9R54_08810, partial [Bacteroidota bacterium]|nr:hypothetical protein [Bacteroidota bacterium]
MIKKYGVIILISLFIISLLTTVFYIRKRQLPNFELIKAVPTDAAIIIKTNNMFSIINKKMENNQIWTELLNIQDINALNKNLNHLDSLISENKDLYKTLKNRKTIISVHNIGKSQTKYLFFLKTKSIKENRSIKNFVLNQFKPNYTINQRQYNNSNIIELKNTNNNNYYLAFTKGIVIFSKSEILIEDAIRQTESSDKLNNKPEFNKVAETAGENVSANIYINFKTFPKLIANCLNENNQQKISNFTNFANWTELDLNIKKDALLLNGFTYTNDSLNNYLNLFLKQEAVDNDIKQILPSNTAIFTSLGISNFQQFAEDLEKYRKNNNTLLKYSNYKNKIKSKYNIDITNLISEIFNEEIALVFPDINHNNIHKNSVIIVKTESKRSSQEILSKAIKKVCRKERKNYNSFIENINIDKETQYKIYHMPIKNIFSNQFGSIFNKVENNYFAFIDNFIVFSDSKKSLNNFIHSFVRGKTLENEIKFQQFSDYLSSESNFYFYTNMFRSPVIISEFLNQKLKTGLNNNINSFRKFQAFALQFRNS